MSFKQNGEGKMKETHLIIKHSVSRAKDSDGYNVVTIWDGNEKFRAMGGGYDMIGTCFGNWLEKNYSQRIKKLIPHDKEYSLSPNDNYGLFVKKDGGFWLDGACGLDCMISIAKKVGLRVKRLGDNKKCYTIGFIVYEENGVSK